MTARVAVEEDKDRREFFTALSALATVALGASACMSAAEEARAPGGEHGEEHEEGGAEVTPGEDLMQEHGVLERVLLVYDEAGLRLDAGTPFDVSLLARSAAVVRRFVEDYHEKQEEDFVFPRLEKLGKETALVATLKQQHRKGRDLTAAILEMTRASGAVDGPALSRALRAFVRMYRPHAAREETVLLPAFRGTMDKDGYHELGERFEEREHEQFGEHGFDGFVTEVTQIEEALGIHDLSTFTPT